MSPRTLLVLGVAPVRIDVLTSIDGMTSFAAAWKRRVDAPFGATPAHWISARDLLAAKVAAGRPQDLADAHALRRALARTGGCR